MDAVAVGGATRLLYLRMRELREVLQRCRPRRTSSIGKQWLRSATTCSRCEALLAAGSIALYCCLDRKEEHRNQTLRLLAVGPDDIGVERLLQKIGVRKEDPIDEVWTVAVRNMGVSKSKTTVNVDITNRLGLEPAQLGYLSGVVPDFMCRGGCPMLCYNPHDIAGQ